MNHQAMKRTGFVGIILEDRARLHDQVNSLLASAHELIIARLGLPCSSATGEAVITLVVSATSDELGALTGRLGQIKGVTVKSALAPIPNQK